MSDDTFNRKTELTDEESRRLDVLSIIQLAIDQLRVIDEEEGFLPPHIRDARHGVALFLNEYLSPESYIDACAQRDRLFRISAMMVAIVDGDKQEDESS